MGIDLSKDMQLASAAGEEELKPLVYHKSSEVIAILINNKNLIGLTRNNVLPVNMRVRIEGEIGKKFQQWRSASR